MIVCIISVSTTALNAIEVLRKKYPWIHQSMSLSLWYAGNDTFTSEKVLKSIESALMSDFVLLDLMGVSESAQNALGEALSKFCGNVVVTNSDRQSVRGCTKLGSFGLKKMGNKKGDEQSWEERMKKARSMMRMAEKASSALPVGKLKDVRNYFWITKYWRYANETNIKNLLALLASEYGKIKEVPSYRPPHVVEDLVIYDPRIEQSFQSYSDWQSSSSYRNNTTITAILFNSGRYPVDTHEAVGKFLTKLEKTMSIVPIAINRITDKNNNLLKKLLPPGLHFILNLQAFRLGQGPMGGNAELAIEMLRKFNVPVLHPFFITRRSVNQWRNDPHGTTPSEFLISIFLPELDGCIETIPIGAVDPDKDTWGGLQILEQRIDKIITRILKWRVLQRKPAQEKKIALILYNYPPGEGGIGCGAFLDALASTEAICTALAENGYLIDPLTKEQILKTFEDTGNFNCPQWNTVQSSITIDQNEYDFLLDNAELKNHINKTWGQFPGTVMNRENAVRVPGFINGNIFIGLQPVRTQGAVSARDYHDPHCPPHHQYAAFYRWLEKTFQADAVIHVGTHGTLEFLPGKETAMSDSCYPDYLIGSMPHIYCYYSGNPSESVIAKRRSHAVMVSHLQPPFITSGLYGDLLELEKLLDEHSAAGNLGPARKKTIEDDILSHAQSLGWIECSIHDITHRLEEIKRSLVPGRLHTFGKPFGIGEVEDFLWQFCRIWNEDDEGYAFQIAQKHGWNWHAILDSPDENQDNIEVIENTCREKIRGLIHGQIKIKSRFDQRIFDLHKALINNNELTNLCNVLDGEYLEAGLGSDVMRNPKVLPSGRNLYQFDPRAVPSPSATRAGIAMAENLVSLFKEKHGRWPKSIAIVLWGLETSKTNGETVAQILHLLGVRYIRSNPWENRLEIIPIQELGRPRVDVTVQMSGFLRDLFPNVIELIQKALEKVGSLKESVIDNPIISHAQKTYEQLLRNGYNESAAQELSLARVFGPDAAVYGTAVTGLIKTKEWEHEQELADAFTHSLRFVYTRNFFGKEMKDLLKRNLSSVEVVSQVRSSMDYEITDLDHYYEYLGGLSKAVEHTTGSKAMILVNDSHTGKVRTESAQHAIQRGIRSRLLNPRWQNGMLSHDYHGAQEFAAKLENMVGLAATTMEVDNELFEDTTKALIFDKTLHDKLHKNNPYALRDIMERLLEAHQRGYWETDENTIEKLKSAYLNLEGDIESNRA